jgi:hypothetical protein
LSSDVYWLAGAALSPSGPLRIRDSTVGKVTALEYRGIVRYRAGQQVSLLCQYTEIITVRNPAWYQVKDGEIPLDEVNFTQLILHRTVVTTYTTSCKAESLHFTHALYLYILYGSENKERLYPYTALTDWFV